MRTGNYIPQNTFVKITLFALIQCCKLKLLRSNFFSSGTKCWISVLKNFRILPMKRISTKKNMPRK
jgi:hypothetical protein